MKLRYKKSGIETFGSRFNLHAMDEVMVGDDSAPVKELDVFLVRQNAWHDLEEAFANHDVIVDNENTRFFEPANERDRQRGYAL